MRTCTLLRATSRIFLASLALLAGCTSTPGPVGPRVIATVTAVIGTPETMRKQQSYILDQQSLIYEGDILQTGADEKVQVVMIDNTMMTLGPGTHLLFHQYLYQDTASAPTARLTLSGGSVLVDNPVTPEALRQKFEIQTPVASISVRGGEFVGGYLFDASTFDVVKLSGNNLFIINEHGSTELRDDASGTSVQGDRGPQPATAWPAAKREAALRTTHL